MALNIHFGRTFENANGAEGNAALNKGRVWDRWVNNHPKGFNMMECPHEHFRRYAASTAQRKAEVIRIQRLIIEHGLLDNTYFTKASTANFEDCHSPMMYEQINASRTQRYINDRSAPDRHNGIDGRQDMMTEESHVVPNMPNHQRPLTPQEQYSANCHLYNRRAMHYGCPNKIGALNQPRPGDQHQ